ncbi:MAG: Ig-like domain-containing protein [Rhodanobacter sp.]|jgi:uncharacterized protein YfaS (alpha-2-macroglobulin family)|nr:Ig-like domain-containing protein [Rhodanobacter sp.]
MTLGFHASSMTPAALQEPPTAQPAKSKPGFRISNADDEADHPAQMPVAASSPLGEADKQSLLARLPALAPAPDDAKDFALRDPSIPAPRPGETVNEAFPPPAPATANAGVLASGPLTVERHAPEGPVELAPQLSVTFSQPMIAVTSLDEIAQNSPPVTLTPQPAGKWRWLGTRTLVFQPDKRFPMATQYAVEVPAGTKAINGQTLAQPVRWTFTTPPLVLKNSAPAGNSVPLEPVIFVGFDQAIDKAAMQAGIDLRGGVGAVPLRLATDAEIQADETTWALAQRTPSDRWLALKPVSKLATATHYTVRIKSGAKSAEGPRATTKEQSFQFDTFGPLKVTNSSCDWSSTCEPLQPFTIRFSNPLDTMRFDKSMVTVTPAIAGIKVDVSYDELVIRGQTKGRTKYTVAIAGALADVQGQTLGKDTVLTFAVGSAQPVVFPAEDWMSVLDPASPRQYTVYSINQPSLRVRIYAVTPLEFRDYLEFREEWEQQRKIKPPGRLVFDKAIATKGVPDELTVTPISLDPALAEGLGHALVIVESARPVRKDERIQELSVWLQSTRLGLTAFAESDAVTAWVTRLEDGSPVEGARVSLLGTNAEGVTHDGIARVPWRDNSLVVATAGKDVAFLGAYPPSLPGDMRWLVFDDRGMYKPGEEVHVKGWVRRANLERGGDFAAIDGVAGKTLHFRVSDPRGAEIGQGEAILDDQGAFDLAFKLPNNANLGRAWVEFNLEQALYNHTFQVQEFRTPEFEVGVKASEGPHFADGHAIATISASYYAGGGLASAPVNWSVKRTSVSFTPPNRSDYHFGPEPRLWWRDVSSSEDGDAKTQTWSSATNAQGLHRIRLDFDALDPPYPMHLDLTGNVTDVNRQQWAGRADLLVHPASAYVGVRLAKNFVRAGDAVDLALIATDIDGKALSGRPISVRAARLEWTRRGNRFQDEEVDAQTCTATSGSAGQDQPVSCTFKPAQGGQWRITAIVTDAQGRKNQTAATLWVTGKDMPKSRVLDGDALTVMADKKEYQPGETAELLVLAPFTPAQGVLTVRRQGIVHIERFAMSEPSQTLHVKLDDSMVPNVEIGVDLVGAAPRENSAGQPPMRPAYASATVMANVLPVSRTLAVTVTPKASATEPGAATAIDVQVKDASGRPANNAEVALVVADEAVLALSGYKTPDPVSVFYAPRNPGVLDLDLRESLLLAEPELKNDRMAPAAMPAPPPPPEPMAGAAPAPMAARSLARARGESPASAPIQIRTDFTPLALFVPHVRTDAAGKVSVPFKLPDNLTRYRVMAVASAGERDFGANESTITARLPLMVRPSAPRFLNFGDRFELPVVVQNQTDAASEVGIVVRAANAVVEDPAAKRVTIPPNDRVEVRFAVHTEKAGTARFQIGIASQNFADASEVKLPVYTPATSEAFATYGEIDNGAIAQPVQMPAGVFPQFGGLEVSTSSTQLAALTDAFLYLVNYPFECNEQVASRVLTVAALRDVLTAFKAKDMPSSETIAASMQTDLDRLKRTQNASGGWGFWQEEPWPIVSIHVAHALTRAQEKGYAPDAAMMQRAQGYLRAIQTHIPTWYPADARRALVAYSLYVRKRMGDADPARAKALIAEAGGVDKLPIEAIGWIWPTIADDSSAAAQNAAIRTYVQNHASETAGAAHFVSGYQDADWVLLSSDRRADGILLEAMIGDQPSSSLVPKLVRGLLAQRKAGHWANTQESAFVLLALDRYFATYEKVTPDFVARVWLGDQFAGQHAYKGRTTQTSNINVPMQWLADKAQGTQNLVLDKDGPGRLYYRIGMQYAPTQLVLAPTDNGFTVSRLYESVDDPGDVRRDADGTWHVKAGARVRVRLAMVAPTRRYHVALVDPLPAGLEVSNPALAVTGELPKDPKTIDAAASSSGRYWYWYRTGYEHQNIRDDRAEAFASLLWEGVWDYTYIARATTPGAYIAPPAKAEEMYAPETFGRSGSDRVIVE